MKQYYAVINMIMMTMLIIIIFSLQSYAQDKPLTYGVRVGISSSVFTQDFQAVSDRLTGFSGGGFITYQITDFFSAGAEVLYIQQGASNLFLNDPLPISTNLTFHTIDIPVLLFFNVPGMEKVSPKIFIGHSFGYNVYVNAKKRYQIDNDPIMYVSGNSSVTSRYERLDFGGVAGIGLDFKTNKMVFSVDARYRLGYTNMFLNDFDRNSFGNVSLNLGVGF